MDEIEVISHVAYSLQREIKNFDSGKALTESG